MHTWSWHGKACYSLHFVTVLPNTWYACMIRGMQYAVFSSITKYCKVCVAPAAWIAWCILHLIERHLTRRLEQPNSGEPVSGIQTMHTHHLTVYASMICASLFWISHTHVLELLCFEACKSATCIITMPSFEVDVACSSKHLLWLNMDPKDSGEAYRVLGAVWSMWADILPAMTCFAVLLLV